MGIGTDPEISLAEARKARDDARKLLATGADPSMEKQRAKFLAKSCTGDKFADIAGEFIEKRTNEGWSNSTIEKANWLLAHYSATSGAFRFRKSDLPTYWQF